MRRTVKTTIKAVLLICLVLSLFGVVLYKSIAYLQDVDYDSDWHRVGEVEYTGNTSVGTVDGLSNNSMVSYHNSITNTGTTPCYVRMFLSASYDASTSDYNLSLVDMSSEWEGPYDGYYYYKKPLGKNKTAPSLCSGVTYKDATVDYEINLDSDMLITYIEMRQSEGYTSAVDAFQSNQ